VNRNEIKLLLTAAREAVKNAYAPYSGFKVSAAVLTGRGSVFTGVNIENASLGLTVCAERVAIFQAVSAGERRIRAVLVFTPTVEFTPPCGACCQVIREFGRNPLIILATEGRLKKLRLKQLLPQGFKLKIKRCVPVRPGKVLIP